jgi:hypothetical protein
MLAKQYNTNAEIPKFWLIPCSPQQPSYSLTSSLRIAHPSSPRIALTSTSLTDTARRPACRPRPLEGRLAVGWLALGADACGVVLELLDNACSMAAYGQGQRRMWVMATCQARRMEVKRMGAGKQPPLE